MAEKWTRLTREDVPGFDKTMTEIVLEMGEHGWVGRLSSKGHAIMRAPDGVTTHAVSRDSLRGRSGRNTRSTFERWKREHLDRGGHS